jgi:phosphoglycerate dehydrogenase-like enzyme
MTRASAAKYSAKIVIPDDIVGTFAQSPEMARLRVEAMLEIHGARLVDQADLGRRIDNADIVLSFRPAFTRFTADVLGTCPRLRYVCVAGAGVEDVDVAYATTRGIAVGNVPSHGKRAIVEHCLALIFDVARHVSAQDRAIRGGIWQSRPGIELVGKTLGIVGLSAIARELAPLAGALGMRVLSWSRDNDPARAAAVGAIAAPLDEVLAQADILSLHLRLFPELKGFLDGAKIARMKDGAILVNTARGELVDDGALVAALESGKLRGAGLDVFAPFPLPPDHPLLGLPNVVLTPSTAWNTIDGTLRNVKRAVDNVLAFIAGAPADIVNAAALGRA